ncbi:hypothetical protein WKI13_09155 [Teredinibacter turnerae]|nr:hypothetical protein [Teredinibacter turnerae]
MKSGNVKYICERMLGLKWLPDISDFAANILEKCDSKLEQMYILGACYFI